MEYKLEAPSGFKLDLSLRAPLLGPASGTNSPSCCIMASLIAPSDSVYSYVPSNSPPAMHKDPAHVANDAWGAPRVRQRPSAPTSHHQADEALFRVYCNADVSDSHCAPVLPAWQQCSSSGSFRSSCQQIHSSFVGIRHSQSDVTPMVSNAVLIMPRSHTETPHWSSAATLRDPHVHALQAASRPIRGQHSLPVLGRRVEEVELFVTRKEARKLPQRQLRSHAAPLRGLSKTTQVVRRWESVPAQSKYRNNASILAPTPGPHTSSHSPSRIQHSLCRHHTSSAAEDLNQEDLTWDELRRLVLGTRQGSKAFVKSVSEQAPPPPTSPTPCSLSWHQDVPEVLKARRTQARRTRTTRASEGQSVEWRSPSWQEKRLALLGSKHGTRIWARSASAAAVGNDTSSMGQGTSAAGRAMSLPAERQGVVELKRKLAADPSFFRRSTSLPSPSWEEKRQAILGSKNGSRNWTRLTQVPPGVSAPPQNLSE